MIASIILDYDEKIFEEQSEKNRFLMKYTFDTCCIIRWKTEDLVGTDELLSKCKSPDEYEVLLNFIKSMDEMTAISSFIEGDAKDDSNSNNIPRKEENGFL